jgi:hypothetical protein
VKAKVTGYDFPSSCMANTEVGFGVWGHVEEADTPTIGFFYRDGPADFLVVDSYWMTKVGKGVHAAVCYKGYAACSDMHFGSPTFWLVFPVEGSYKLDVFGGYISGDTTVIEDGPYPVTVDVSPFVPPSVSVTGFNVPLKAYAGMAVDCSVSGHVDVGGGNPCVGLMYVNGPASSINIDGSVIGKGQAKVFGYTSFKDVCTNIDFKGSAVYPVAGTYKLGVISGYIDVLGGTVYVTSRSEVNVDVTVATANVSGKVVESLLFGLIKRPSTGAVVSLDSLKSTQSQAGMYSLTDVPLGSYKISVSKSWFERKEQYVTLSEIGKTYSLDFEIGISKWVNYGLAAGMVAAPLLALTALATKKPAKKMW